MVKTKPFKKRLFISTIGPTQSRLKFDSLFWEINFYQNLGDLLKSSQVWIDIWPVVFELWEWTILLAYNILDFRRLFSYSFCSCLMNCGLEVLPNVKATFVANCTNSPCYTKSALLSYHWRLFQETNESWSELHQMQEIRGTRANSNFFTINPDAIIPGRKYRLTIDVENMNDDSSKGFSAWLFESSTIPFGGSCTANKLSGVAIQTVFTLKCANWNDPNTPLLYEFLLPLAEGLSAILSYSYTSATEIMLPPGEFVKNYSLTIDVVVASSIGSSSSTSLTMQVSR